MLILLATDRSGDDDAAVFHAAALAAANQGQLVTLFANSGRAAPTPHVDADTLGARWHCQLAHELRVIHGDGDGDVADELVTTMNSLSPSLVVVGTHSRVGWDAAVHGSVGQAIARNTKAPTLIVPNHQRGFVDAATGAIHLSRILVPAETLDDAQIGCDAVRRLLPQASTSEVEIVHVTDSDLVNLDTTRLGASFTRLRGDLKQAISDHARAREASLVVMPTRGHDGIVDVLLGSHTERVIRSAPCPVLSVLHTP